MISRAYDFSGMVKIMWIKQNNSNGQKWLLLGRNIDGTFEKLMQLVENIGNCDRLGILCKENSNLKQANQTMEQVISYENAWCFDANDMFGLIMPMRWCKDVGGYNCRMNEEGIYELFLRVLKYYEKCNCMLLFWPANFVLDDMANLYQKAYAYAFIIRDHIECLKKKGLFNSVFLEIGKRMQQKGCFTQFQTCLNQFMTDESIYEEVARETAPFIVLQGEAICAGVLQRFADDLCNALVEYGQAVIKICHDMQRVNGIKRNIIKDTVVKTKSWDALKDLRDNVFKGIIAFQDPNLESGLLKAFKGPKFQFWLDYPLHFRDILCELPNDYAVLCQDGDYARLIRKYLKTENAICFPPGGIDLGEPDKKSERSLDIVFVGEYFQECEEELDEEERLLFDELVKHPSMTSEEAVKKIFFSEEDYAEDEFLEKCFEMKRARRTVIAYFRRKVISTILEAGYQLHVYGNNWNLYQGNCSKNLICHKQVTVDEALSIFRHAKVALNVMSWHKNGMTERVANIMLSGAICLSDESIYLRELEGQNLISLFSLEHLGEIPEILSRLLTNHDLRDKMACKAYLKAKDDFSWNARARELIQLAERIENKRNEVKIYVATHVKFNPPNNPIYVPLHVGRNGKKDLGYLGDDTGENISDLNYLYGELTGLFWIWQNVENVDYVGMCHYRRYFISEQKRELTEKEYLELLRNCDAIVPKHADCIGDSYYEHFGRAHNNHDLDAVEHALKRLYPEYGPAYDQAMQGKIFYWGNLMVTSLSILKAYAEWLFNIFLEAGEEIDVSNYDDYHKRVYGFLSEQMFYVFALANGLVLCEVQVGISAEKAETGELVIILRQMMEEGKKKEAMKLIEERLQVRPDLLLAGSDIKGELAELYQKLREPYD